MTLSQRIAALDGPDRAIDAKIAKALGLPHGMKGGVCMETRSTWTIHEQAAHFTSSLDAALSAVEPSMQDYVMHEAMKRVGNRGVIVGKYAGQLARAICEVNLEGRGL